MPRPKVRSCVDVFERARQVAKKSTMLQQHGCVIVNKDGFIEAEGYNHHVNFMSHRFSMHSEMDALLKVKQKGRKFLETCTLVVVRIHRQDPDEHPLKLSKPCEHCTKEIKECGIGKIFYSA